MKSFIAVLMFILVSGSVFAQGNKVSIDLTKLDPETAAAVLQAQKMANGEISPLEMADQAEKWANIGVNIGEAIAGACERLGTEVNEFVKTPVGVLVVAVVLWEIVGDDLWSVVGGGLIWIIFATLIFRSHTYYHKAKKVTNKKTGDVTYVRRYEFADCSDDWSWEVISNIVHIVAFGIISFVCSIAIFI